MPIAHPHIESEIPKVLLEVQANSGIFVNNFWNLSPELPDSPGECDVGPHIDNLVEVLGECVMGIDLNLLLPSPDELFSAIGMVSMEMCQYDSFDWFVGDLVKFCLHLPK